MKSSVKVRRWCILLALIGFVIWVASIYFKEYVELMFRIVAMLFMMISLLMAMLGSEVE
jgi:hypothetical protein